MQQDVSRMFVCSLEMSTMKQESHGAWHQLAGISTQMWIRPLLMRSMRSEACSCPMMPYALPYVLEDSIFHMLTYGSYTV